MQERTTLRVTTHGYDSRSVHVHVMHMLVGAKPRPSGAVLLSRETGGTVPERERAAVVEGQAKPSPAAGDIYANCDSSDLGGRREEGGGGTETAGRQAGTQQRRIEEGKRKGEKEKRKSGPGGGILVEATSGDVGRSTWQPVGAAAVASGGKGTTVSPACLACLRAGIAAAGGGGLAAHRDVGGVPRRANEPLRWRG